MKTIKHVVLAVVVAMAAFDVLAADSVLTNHESANTFSKHVSNDVSVKKFTSIKPTENIDQPTIDSMNRDPANPFAERADNDVPVTESAGIKAVPLDQATIDRINRDPVNPFSERSE